MKTYNKSFKEQALKLSDEIGLKKASEQLGVNYSTLVGWRRIRKKNNSQNIENIEKEPLTDREKQMQLEIQELKQANEILKDALGFFVKIRNYITEKKVS